MCNLFLAFILSLAVHPQKHKYRNIPIAQLPSKTTWREKNKMELRKNPPKIIKYGPVLLGFSVEVLYILPAIMESVIGAMNTFFIKRPKSLMVFFLFILESTIIIEKKLAVI